MQAVFSMLLVQNATRPYHCRSRRNPKGEGLELEIMHPILLSFCFLSLCAWLKSPLGEPYSCCQATRLPGSKALMNSHSVMEVALPTHRTKGRTGGQTCVCVCVCVCACVGLQPERGHKCTHEVEPCSCLASSHSCIVFSDCLFIFKKS